MARVEVAFAVSIKADRDGLFLVLAELNHARLIHRNRGRDALGCLDSGREGGFPEQKVEEDDDSQGTSNDDSGDPEPGSGNVLRNGEANIYVDIEGGVGEAGHDHAGGSVSGRDTEEGTVSIFTVQDGEEDEVEGNEDNDSDHNTSGANSALDRRERIGRAEDIVLNCVGSITGGNRSANTQENLDDGENDATKIHFVFLVAHGVGNEREDEDCGGKQGVANRHKVDAKDDVRRVHDQTEDGTGIKIGSRLAQDLNDEEDFDE